MRTPDPDAAPVNCAMTMPGQGVPRPLCHRRGTVCIDDPWYCAQHAAVVRRSAKRVADARRQTATDDLNAEAWEYLESLASSHQLAAILVERRRQLLRGESHAKDVPSSSD
jgi:hypothetical protein